MTQETIPNEVTDAATDIKDADLAVVAGAKNAHAVEDFRRLVLVDELAEDFRVVARRAITALTSAKKVFRDYEPAYSKALHEILTISLDDAPSVKALMSIIQDSTSLEEFNIDWLDTIKLGHYATVLGYENGTDQDTKVYLFRSFDKNKRLSSSGGLRTFFKNGVFDSFKEEVMTFDESYDCIVINDIVYINSPSRFESVFGHKDVLLAKADAVVTTVASKINISNPDLFREYASNYLVARKLASIERKGLLGQLTMEKVLDVIDRWNLGVDTVEIDGVQNLVFDSNPSKMWDFLHLLDDDSLLSEMTGTKYISNSKRNI